MSKKSQPFGKSPKQNAKPSKQQFGRGAPMSRRPPRQPGR
jgi:hypothetical protein